MSHFSQEAEIECHDNGDGSALVKYHPTAVGEYAVHILCDNDDIPKSPYISHVGPKGNYQPESVKCSGLGIGPIGVILNKLTSFIIDARTAGKAKLLVNVSVR